MKNITVSVDDEIYHAARVEAATRRTSLSAMVREFLVGLRAGQAAEQEEAGTELEKLWAMSDRKHARRTGSAGPLNREQLHERGISRH